VERYRQSHYGTGSFASGDAAAERPGPGHRRIKRSRLLLRVCRTRNCTILSPAHGAAPPTSTFPASGTRRHCCPMARSWSQGVTVCRMCFQSQDLSRPIIPLSCSIPPPGIGIVRAVSTQAVVATQHRCYRMATSWLRAATPIPRPVPAKLSRARNDTMQAACFGASPATSTQHALVGSGASRALKARRRISLMYASIMVSALGPRLFAARRLCEAGLVQKRIGVCGFYVQARSRQS
jgi:hypothetical protein